MHVVGVTKLDGAGRKGGAAATATQVECESSSSGGSGSKSAVDNSQMAGVPRWNQVFGDLAVTRPTDVVQLCTFSPLTAVANRRLTAATHPRGHTPRADTRESEQPAKNHRHPGARRRRRTPPRTGPAQRMGRPTAPPTHGPRQPSSRPAVDAAVHDVTACSRTQQEP